MSTPDPSRRFWSVVCDHNDFILALPRIPRAQRQGETHTFSTQLIESMKAHAREVWYPSLSALQVVENRRANDASAKSDYVSIIDIWKEHGTLLGLQEDSEKKRREREARRRCAWNECAFSASPASHPLRACSGCGDVFYCGTKCQNK